MGATTTPTKWKKAVAVEAFKFCLSGMYERLAEVEGVASITEVFYKFGDAIAWFGDDVNV